MPTVLFGKQSLPAAELKADKKTAVRIGPLGMGRRALYLNSFYISRMYYVMWTDIRRVYKLVAMSKGGFTGIGAFGSMSYLVVELRDGRSKRCQIKYESQTDQAIAWIAEHHPEIPTVSVAAQRKLDAKKLEESRKPVVELDEEAGQSIQALEDAKKYLEENPALYNNLSSKAAKKRVQQNLPPGRRALGITVFAVSIAMIAAGIPMLLMKNHAGIYMVMFGTAFLIFSLMGNLIPIGRNSPKRVEREWQDAVLACGRYIGNRDSFPVPARYAHPVVIERMIRAVRDGRAGNEEQALEIVKDDLRKLNRSVKVSQEEYDEVVAVKPMFLVSDYR